MPTKRKATEAVPNLVGSVNAKLLVRIVHEECAEPLRDLRDVPNLFERIFARVGDLMDDNAPFVGETEPTFDDDISEGENG